MRVTSVVGARPQFVKAAVVSAAFADLGVDELLVHTGQHFDDDMSAVFFDELGIPAPAKNLEISGGTHAEMTGRMLIALERELLEHAPHAVVVFGDTNSTLAASLAAAKVHIPVVHVEAGLRSFNRAMPEEVNRVLTDHLAELLLTPTATATQNLLDEGRPADQIVQVGDVMYDAAIRFAAVAADTSDVLERLGVAAGDYVLATVHRAENTDEPVRLGAALGGLNAIARERAVVLPMHPRTRQAADALGVDTSAIRVVDPVGYLDMVRLEACAALVCTDSGGVQKEAFFHRVPCVTLRDETEWVELVDAGWNRIVPPTSTSQVVDGLRAALQAGPGRDVEPYGDGHAAELTAREVLSRFGS